MKENLNNEEVVKRPFRSPKRAQLLSGHRRRVKGGQRVHTRAERKMSQESLEASYIHEGMPD